VRNGSFTVAQDRRLGIDSQRRKRRVFGPDAGVEVVDVRRVGFRAVADALCAPREVVLLKSRDGRNEGLKVVRVREVGRRLETGGPLE